MFLDSIFELPLLAMHGILNSDTSNDQRFGETSFEDRNDVLAVHGVAPLRRGRFDTSPHLFVVSNHQVCTMLLLARIWGDVWHVKKQCVRMHLCVYQKWPKSLGFYVTVDRCAFTHEHSGAGTRRASIHPSTHSDSDTDTRHNKSRRGCARLNLFWSTKDWHVGQVGGCHRQGPWMAK